MMAAPLVRFVRPAVAAFVLPVSGCVARELPGAGRALSHAGFDTVAVVAHDDPCKHARGITRVLGIPASESCADVYLKRALDVCGRRGHCPDRVALLLDGSEPSSWPWRFTQTELLESASRAGSRAIVIQTQHEPATTDAPGRVLYLSGSLDDAVKALVVGFHEEVLPFTFGPHVVPAEHAFASTAHSIAIVNLKPVTDGHALVISRRSVRRFRDLTRSEVSDLWACVQSVSAGLEARFGAEAATIVLQDGAAAGQTVPHVHVHVIPRHEADLEDNDQVYDMVRRFLFLSSDARMLMFPPPVHLSVK